MKLQWNKVGDTYFSKATHGAIKGRFQIFPISRPRLWMMRDFTFSHSSTHKTLAQAKAAAKKRLPKIAGD